MSEGLREVIALARRILGDNEATMRQWLHGPNLGLRGESPMSLIEKGQGEVVLAYLERFL
jgi:uncharacterized protein (DUF2384 family)